MARRKALGLSGRTQIAAGFSDATVAKQLNSLGKSLNNLKAVKTVKSKSRYKGNRPTTKTTRRRVQYGMFEYRESGFEAFDNQVMHIAEDATQNLRGKAWTWAVETMQMMKALAPVRTENLMDSVKILNQNKGDESTFANKLQATNKSPKEIIYYVGIDEQAILPPPLRKKAKHGKRAGKMVTMSNFNYAGRADQVIKKMKHNGYRGYDFLNRWQRAAYDNFERIFK